MNFRDAGLSVIVCTTCDSDTINISSAMLWFFASNNRYIAI